MEHPGYVSVKYLGSIFSSFSFSLSFFFVSGSFPEETFDSAREDFPEEGAFRFGFGESSSNA